MHTQRISVLFFGTLAAAALLLGSARGQDTNADAASLFKGKVVMLQLAGKEQSLLLENAALVELGERFIVVGRHVRFNDSPGYAWTDGLQSGAAWESVDYFLIFDSVEDFRKRAKMIPTTMYRKESTRVPALRDGEKRSTDSVPKSTTERPTQLPPRKKSP